MIPRGRFRDWNGRGSSGSTVGAVLGEIPAAGRGHDEVHTSATSPSVPRSGREQAFCSFPCEETFATVTSPLSPPCGGRCHGVTEEVSADSDQIGHEMGSPPLPSASPPQGGRGGVFQRSPRGGKRGSELSVAQAGDGAVAKLQAHFHPAGVWGLLYWYGLRPIHMVMFRRLAELLAEGVRPRAGAGRGRHATRRPVG